MDKFYVKKPLRIRAFRYGFETMPEWFLNNENPNWSIATLQDCDGHILIQTLEGTMRADKGDYIIQGIKGEIYPCKADIFESSYNFAPDLIEEEFL